ncbi:ATP-binding cassette domain-containing protein, partial [Dactylosporangium sp. NPDC000521]|uniref:ATP-binding cassette domain-containing protein n=1 Tax=Dactylosporangium sp. NPDC000521 TaxID=3363975 RepID=UPI0036A79CE9
VTLDPTDPVSIKTVTLDPAGPVSIKTVTLDPTDPVSIKTVTLDPAGPVSIKTVTLDPAGPVSVMAGVLDPAGPVSVKAGTPGPVDPFGVTEAGQYSVTEAGPVVRTPADGRAGLDDPGSGFAAGHGLLTAIAAARPEHAAAIADRIGLLDPASEARLLGVPLRHMRIDDVRSHVVVADNGDRLFRGRLREELGGGHHTTEGGTARSDATVLSALAAAAAQDIVDALPDGLDTEIAERGRDFSGGQQQRLRLARVLALDPPVLVLVEPTSAVDTHTEALIARRLPAARAGRTTVVCTTSPLLLDQADVVAFVDATGRVAATGTHRELLATCPAYSATVTREEDA